MRLPAACLFLVVSLVACARESATAPAASATDQAAGDQQTGPNTAVDGAVFSFELPGKWERGQAVDGGYDFRRGETEQVIVASLPSNLDDAPGIEALSSAQQKAIRTLCKRGALVGAPERAKEPFPLLRVRASCEAPQVVATFVAAASHGTVISYEHYRYDVGKTTPELERADAAMFASLHIKTASAACPNEILAQADSQEGLCLEAAVLGEAVIEDCGGKLRGRGWRRDDLGAKLIGKQTGKTIVCYHAPAKE